MKNFKNLFTVLVIFLLSFLWGCGFGVNRFSYAEKPAAKKAVLVVPQSNFRDEELFQTRITLEDGGISVKIASTVTDEIKGMLGGNIKPDMLLKDVNIRDLDALVFIGGQGAVQYWNDPLAQQLARDAFQQSRLVAAICLAPVTLAKSGILEGKRATVWHSEAEQLKKAGAIYTGRPVEVDGRIITAQGPLATGEFADQIVKALNFK